MERDDSKNSITPLHIDNGDEHKPRKLSNNVSWEGSMLVISMVHDKDETDEEEDEHSTRNFIIGTLFWTFGVLSRTCGHTIIKILTIRSPYVTPNDSLLFMGLMNVPFSFAYGIKNKHNLNLFSYPKSIVAVVLIRAMFGLFSNFFINASLGLIPLSKMVFILSLTPITSAILAGIFLKERITWPTIACIFGTVFGIYLLTLNQEEGGSNKNSITGYILMWTAIWLWGGIFIMIRYMNLYNVPVSVNSGTLGCFFIIQAIIAYFWKDGLINIWKYTFVDFILLWGKIQHD